MNTIGISNRLKSQTRKGSVLVICMVLAAVGTIGVAGWLSMLDAKLQMTEFSLEGMKRRIQNRNDMIFARWAVQSQLLASSTPNPNSTTLILGDGIAQCTINATTTAPLSALSSTRTSKVGATPFKSYTVDANVSVRDGDFNQGWSFQLRSAHPVMGNELFTVYSSIGTQTENTSFTGNINVKGKAMFWPSNYSPTETQSVKANYMGIQSYEEAFSGDGIVPKLLRQNPDNQQVPLMRFPYHPQTAGQIGEGKFSGKMSTIEFDAASDDNEANTYVYRVRNIGNYVSVNPSRVELYGTSGYGVGGGPTTVTEGPNDLALIAKINDGVTPDADLAAELIANSLLSSNVMNELLNRVPKMNDTDLLSVLSSNYPLADDVLPSLADKSLAYSEIVRETAFAASQTAMVSDRAGGVTIFLNEPQVPHLILRNFSEIDLRGQPDETSADARVDDEMRAIVVVNSDNVKLDRVRFSNYNRRRILLAIKNVGVMDGVGLLDALGNPNSSGTTHTQFVFGGTNAFPDWRMIGEFEGIITDWDTTAVSSVTINGGLRMNQGMHVVSPGAVTIQKETNFEGFGPFLTRTAWLESFRANF